MTAWRAVGTIEELFSKRVELVGRRQRAGVPKSICCSPHSGDGGGSWIREQTSRRTLPADRRIPGMQAIWFSRATSVWPLVRRHPVGIHLRVSADRPCRAAGCAPRVPGIRQRFDPNAGDYGNSCRPASVWDAKDPERLSSNLFVSVLTIRELAVS